MPRRPNIMLVLCDQLRAFEVGCYGGRVARTPSVDRLAAEGVRFGTAVTNYPICMAARSVLLSGQYNRTCTGGVSNVHCATWPGDFAMPEYPFAGRPHLRDTTLPEALRAAGYSTTVIGKWHVHSWPHDVGFDRWLIPRVHHCHTGQSYTRDGGPEFVPAGYSVDFEAAEVESFVRTAARGSGPFFLYYSISPPHCPVGDAPDDVLRLYDPSAIPLRPNVDESTPIADAEHWLRVYRYDFRYYSHHLPYTEALPSGYGLRGAIAEYLGLPTWMDAALGRALAALDAAGIADNTIVVFSSDHGDNLGSHGLVQKGTPNEESIRIPLVARWPVTLPAGCVADRQVGSLVDIAPTLLSLAGVPVPPAMQGQSLACVAGGSDEVASTAHAIVELGGGAAVRSPDGMLYVPFGDDGRTLSGVPGQVYDTRDDPYQLRNLADRSGLPEWAERDLRALRKWDGETRWMA